jgi:hypothetical protein
MNIKLVLGITAGVLVYFAFLATIITLTFRWSRRLFRRKVDALGGALAASGGQKIAEHASAGIYWSHQTEYEVGGRRVIAVSRPISRSFIRVGMRIASGPYAALIVFPEGKVERLGKAIGLNREVQTGDEAFDKLAYLDSIDSDANVKRLMESAEVRTAVAELLQLGYRVQFDVNGVEAFQIIYSLSAVDTTHAAAAAAVLGRLADAAPRFAASEVKVMSPYRWQLGMLLIAPLFGGMFLAGLMGAMLHPTVDGAHRVTAVFAAGGAAWVAYVLALSWVLHGRSYAFRVVGFGAVFALLGVPAAGGVGALMLNQKLDDGPTQTFAAVVRAKTCHKGNCSLHVTSWRDPNETTQLSAGSAYKNLQIGDTLHVTSHPGRFGWEWVTLDSADRTATATP